MRTIFLITALLGVLREATGQMQMNPFLMEAIGFEPPSYESHSNSNPFSSFGMNARGYPGAPSDSITPSVIYNNLLALQLQQQRKQPNQQQEQLSPFSLDLLSNQNIYQQQQQTQQQHEATQPGTNNLNTQFNVPLNSFRQLALPKTPNVLEPTQQVLTVIQPQPQPGQLELQQQLPFQQKLQLLQQQQQQQEQLQQLQQHLQQQVFRSLDHDTKPIRPGFISNNKLNEHVAGHAIPVIHSRPSASPTTAPTVHLPPLMRANAATQFPTPELLQSFVDKSNIPFSEPTKNIVTNFISNHSSSLKATPLNTKFQNSFQTVVIQIPTTPSPLKVHQSIGSDSVPISPNESNIPSEAVLKVAADIWQELKNNNTGLRRDGSSTLSSTRHNGIDVNKLLPTGSQSSAISLSSKELDELSLIMTSVIKARYPQIQIDTTPAMVADLISRSPRLINPLTQLSSPLTRSVNVGSSSPGSNEPKGMTANTDANPTNNALLGSGKGAVGRETISSDQSSLWNTLNEVGSVTDQLVSLLLSSLRLSGTPNQGTSNIDTNPATTDLYVPSDVLKTQQGVYKTNEANNQKQRLRHDVLNDLGRDFIRSMIREEVGSVSTNPNLQPPASQLSQLSSGSPFSPKSSTFSSSRAVSSSSAISQPGNSATSWSSAAVKTNASNRPNQQRPEFIPIPGNEQFAPPPQMNGGIPRRSSSDIGDSWSSSLMGPNRQPPPPMFRDVGLDRPRTFVDSNINQNSLERSFMGGNEGNGNRNNQPIDFRASPGGFDNRKSFGNDIRANRKGIDGNNNILTNFGGRSTGFQNQNSPGRTFRENQNGFNSQKQNFQPPMYSNERPSGRINDNLWQSEEPRPRQHMRRPLRPESSSRSFRENQNGFNTQKQNFQPPINSNERPFSRINQPKWPLNEPKPRQQMTRPMPLDRKRQNMIPLLDKPNPAKIYNRPPPRFDVNNNRGIKAPGFRPQPPQRPQREMSGFQRQNQPNIRAPGPQQQPTPQRRFNEPMLRRSIPPTNDQFQRQNMPQTSRQNVHIGPNSQHSFPPPNSGNSPGNEVIVDTSTPKRLGPLRIGLDINVRHGVFPQGQAPN